MIAISIVRLSCTTPRAGGLLGKMKLLLNLKCEQTSSYSTTTNTHTLMRDKENWNWMTEKQPQPIVGIAGKTQNTIRYFMICSSVVWFSWLFFFFLAFLLFLTLFFIRFWFYTHFIFSFDVPIHIMYTLSQGNKVVCIKCFGKAKNENKSAFEEWGKMRRKRRWYLYTFFWIKQMVWTDKQKLSLLLRVRKTKEYRKRVCLRERERSRRKTEYIKMNKRHISRRFINRLAIDKRVHVCVYVCDSPYSYLHFWLQSNYTDLHVTNVTSAF